MSTPWKGPEINGRPLAILGGGVLGRRIATVWVAAGYNVNIRDPSQEQCNAAQHFVEINAPIFAKKYGENAKFGKIQAHTDLAPAVENAWFVIEAVPEKLQLKISTMGDLDRLAPADCILGSNSSSYKSSEMLEQVDPKRRNRVCNTHYSMPPDNRTVEIMTCGQTDPAVFPFLVQHHKAVGMLPAVARKESTGFILNRIWAAVKREIMMVLAEGVSEPAEIDALWWEMFGRPQSVPCAMMDMVGLDTVAFIEDHYVAERHLDHSLTTDFIKKNYIEQGKLGAKSGNGGLYPPGHTTKTQGPETSHHDSHAAPTLYILELGTLEGFHAGKVYVGGADGREMKAIVHDQPMPDGVDVSLKLGRIFWTNMGTPNVNDGAVLSAKLDGSDIQTVISKGLAHTPKQLTIDHINAKLYFCDREGLRVHRCNLDGSAHEIIVQTGDFNIVEEMHDQTRWCVGITVDTKTNQFYWTQKGYSKSGTGRIFRASTDIKGQEPAKRSDVELLFDNRPECIDLEIVPDTGMLYWTDRGEFPLGCTINRSYVGPKINGSANAGTKEMPETEILAAHFHEPIGLRLDTVNHHIYVADMGGSVYRIGMDGAGKKRIYDSDTAIFTGLALAHLG